MALARALAIDPICLPFDEPTSAPDPEMIGEVLDVMVDQVAKRVVFMDHGKIMEDAPAARFFGASASERAKTFLARILRH